MEMIRPSAELRNHYSEISKTCCESRQPVYITVNERGETVLTGMVDHQQTYAELKLLRMLADAAKTGISGTDCSAASDFYKVNKAKEQGIICAVVDAIKKDGFSARKMELVRNRRNDMNNFIIAAAFYGYDKFLYDLFFGLGFVAVFLFYLWRGKCFGVKPMKSVLLVLIVYPSVVLWMFVQYWLETGTFGGNNIVRCFVYMPLFAIPASKILKLTWKQACDILAPATCVVHSVSHWGCIFIGCCQGYPSSWGLFNTQLGRICFPSQPLEALTALFIIIVILQREKRNNHQVDGLSMPIMLILFGITRFFWEFFRDNPKIWLGCSALAFHALFMSVVGLVMYIIIRKGNEKQLKLNV